MTRVLLACGVGGPLLFIAVFLLDGATRPGYSALQNYVSSLSLGDRGGLQVANFLVMSALVLAASIGWRRALAPGRASRVGPVALALVGAGLAVAGLFATDPSFGYPPGAAHPASPSGHAVLHSLGALLLTVALTAACFALARRFRADGARGWRTASLWVGVLFPVLFVWSSIGSAGTGGDPLAGIPRGLLQRASIVLGWIWISAVSWRLRSDIVL